MKNFALTLALTSTLFLIACGGNGNTLSGGSNPLVAQYVVTAPAGSSVAVQFGPDAKYGFTTSSTTVPDGETSVTVLVAGMKQNSTYHMRAVTTLPDGTQQQDGDRTFTTGTVSSDSIPTSTVAPGGTPSPGIELLGLNPGPGSSSPKFTIAALDPSGNLIWYYDYPHDLGIAQPIKLLANGHFLIIFYGGPGGAAGGTVREIDLAGNTINEFTVDDLNPSLNVTGQMWTAFTAFAIHHDFVALPNGHLLLLVNSTQDFTDLVGYPGTQTVLGDSIVDLDENLKPVWVWSAFDHLDVNRHPMMFATPPPPAPPYHDWTHSNALLYSPDDGNILLSIRHQYWVIKIDYANGQGTGDVLWKLGYQGDFNLLNSTSPADWFYAQHFANIISPNSAGVFQLAVFDNGDNRVLDSSGTTCGSTGAPACYSRPAIFEVNEADKTAQVIWSYPTVYSFWGGAIQELPNSNMFVDITTPSDNSTGARFLELTQEANPQIVWQLDVNDQNSYRTIHLPSLYPGVQW